MQSIQDILENAVNLISQSHVTETTDEWDGYQTDLYIGPSWILTLHDDSKILELGKNYRYENLDMLIPIQAKFSSVIVWEDAKTVDELFNTFSTVCTVSVKKSLGFNQRCTSTLVNKNTWIQSYLDSIDHVMFVGNLPIEFKQVLKSYLIK